MAKLGDIEFAMGLFKENVRGLQELAATYKLEFKFVKSRVEKDTLIVDYVITLPTPIEFVKMSLPSTLTLDDVAESFAAAKSTDQIVSITHVCSCDAHMDSPCRACFPEEAKIWRDDGTHPLEEVEHGCRVPGCGRPRTKEFDVQVDSGFESSDGVSTYQRQASCDIYCHRTYMEAAAKELYQKEVEFDIFRGKADFSTPAVMAEVPIHANRFLPKGKAQLRLGANHYVDVKVPETKEDLDRILALYPDAEKVLLSPVDMSLYTKNLYARTSTRHSAPAVCECGAAATGIQPRTPGHSSWCPVKE